eukprot:4457836-Prymnesium_polylepis.1
MRHSRRRRMRRRATLTRNLTGFGCIVGNREIEYAPRGGVGGRCALSLTPKKGVFRASNHSSHSTHALGNALRSSIGLCSTYMHAVLTYSHIRVHSASMPRLA